MFRKPLLYLSLSVTLVAAACSVLRKDDPEKDVRNFLASLQADLQKTDAEILQYFNVKQTREAVLSIVSILQNKDPFIVCEASFSNASITFEREIVRVEVPGILRVKELNSEDVKSVALVFWLQSKNDKYIITNLDGEDFYQQFVSIKNANEWAAEQKLALQARESIYEKAKTLEQSFDSVIWYATYKQNYFYVVTGNWDLNDRANNDTKMGLADEEGKLIIPMEFDLIGTIGFEKPGLVEVKKEGKIGYFDLINERLIVSPDYELIIPYGMDNVWAIVKNDSTYGWLDNNHQYQAGFPSDRVERWVKDFQFLNRSIRLKPGNQVFCEIPNEENAGSGIIIPSSFLTRYGIFEEIESGISTTNVPLHGWTDYKETTGSFFEQVTDKINAVVTTIRERYLEGREEFYTSNTLLFVDGDRDTLNVSTISGEEVLIRSIDSTLLEVRTPHDHWFMENEACDEVNLFQHIYFQIDEHGTIQRLTSNRLYPQTEFVKLDSSYLTGEFLVYNPELEQNEKRTFLSVNTITFMRNEILASYGYSFPGTEVSLHFKQIGDWYKSQYSSIDDFKDQMTETDKHNLEFLNRILSTLQSAVA